MERVILKDFSVRCADDSLKLVTGKILGCKAINLIFKCGFTLKNNNVKMPPVCSTDLYFIHINPEMSSFYRIVIKKFSSAVLLQLPLESLCSCKDHCLDSVSHFESRALLFLLFTFNFWDKRWKIFKHMKVQILALWEFPKDQTCVIL